jgi:hypothetical protein
MIDLWNARRLDFMEALHGPGPWQFIRATNQQKAIEADSPDGFEQAFVHRPRGLHDQPGFTCLNVDCFGAIPTLPYPPSAVFEIGQRTAVMWFLDAFAWPSAEFYRRQEMLNVLLGTPSDRISLSRLLPLPGGREFPCRMQVFDPDARYALNDFKL